MSCCVICSTTIELVKVACASCGNHGSVQCQEIHTLALLRLSNWLHDQLILCGTASAAGSKPAEQGVNAVDVDVKPSCATAAV